MLIKLIEIVIVVCGKAIYYIKLVLYIYNKID